MTTSATVAAEYTPDHLVTAPELKLIDERVSEPDPGKHWKNPPPRLAMPSARHWRLKSNGWRVLPAIDWAMASASSKPRNAIAAALPDISRIQSSLISGT